MEAEWQNQLLKDSGDASTRTGPVTTCVPCTPRSPAAACAVLGAPACGATQPPSELCHIRWLWSTPGARTRLPPSSLSRPHLWRLVLQTFFCGGRLVAGPAWVNLLGTVALILTPTGVFLGLGVPDVARAYSWALLAIALWLPLFSTAALLVTGCSDPGIIPRVPPPTPAEFPPSGRPPRTVEVEVAGKRVTLKWNDSCNFYQPPRAHHCSVNNDCVEKFDHHCPWVGTTIGQRNYRTFLLFVFNTSLLCIYTFALCALQVHVKMHPKGGGSLSVAAALAKAPAAVAVMVICFLGFFFVGGLASFHAYLVATNQTTYENFRYGYDKGSNPYSRGSCWLNCLEVWCTPRLPAKVNFRAWADEAGDVESHGVAAVDRLGRPIQTDMQPEQPPCGCIAQQEVKVPPEHAAGLPVSLGAGGGSMEMQAVQRQVTA